MKIALQYRDKRDGCTMALFSKPKSKCGSPGFGRISVPQSPAADSASGPQILDSTSARLMWPYRQFLSVRVCKPTLRHTMPDSERCAPPSSDSSLTCSTCICPSWSWVRDWECPWQDSMNKRRGQCAGPVKTVLPNFHHMGLRVGAGRSGYKLIAVMPLVPLQTFKLTKHRFQATDPFDRRLR
jgi:hypothetical protein